MSHIGTSERDFGDKAGDDLYTQKERELSLCLSVS